MAGYHMTTVDRLAMPDTAASGAAARLAGDDVARMPPVINCVKGPAPSRCASG